jgi:hypothetical protein
LTEALKTLKEMLDKSAMARTPRWRPNPTQTKAQRRLAERIYERETNPFEVSRAAGLPRTFVYEFLTGKKATFGSKSISKLAAALDWDVSVLAEIVSGNDGLERVASDPVDRALAEAAFLGLMRLFRPDIEDEPALVELFQTLASMKPDSRSTAPLVDQMFFRAQLAARKFAPK